MIHLTMLPTEEAIAIKMLEVIAREFPCSWCWTPNVECPLHPCDECPPTTRCPDDLVS